MTPSSADARGDGAGSALLGKRWVETDGVHIDVRGLDPPGPLVAVLQLVESIADRTPVFVHHDRDPKMLFPELAERGWSAAPLDAPPGEVRWKLERVE